MAFTVVASLEAAEDVKTLEVDPPQSLDFMERRLEEIGDVARSDEHRLSIARNVDNATLIFSSSNVMRAFWNINIRHLLSFQLNLSYSHPYSVL